MRRTGGLLVPRRITGCVRPGFRAGKSPLLSLALLFLSWPQLAHSPNAQEITLLELGKPIERELSGGQEHGYQISLTEGQYASIIVEQRGIDVVVQLQGKEGRGIVSFDGEYRSQREEKVEMVGGATGSYRLSVR